jgi:hypothetical protein
LTLKGFLFFIGGDAHQQVARDDRFFLFPWAMRRDGYEHVQVPSLSF